MKEHNSNQISLSISGYPIDSGRGEIGGAFLKMTPRGPDFNDTQSLDAEVTRSATNERRYDAEIYLMSTSSGNAFLSALSEADRTIPGGAGVGIFDVTDRNSQGTVYFGEHCWITQRPEHEFGEKPVLLTWKLTVVLSVGFIAGN